jgi:hypothetical protein
MRTLKKSDHMANAPIDPFINGDRQNRSIALALVELAATSTGRQVVLGFRIAEAPRNMIFARFEPGAVRSVDDALAFMRSANAMTRYSPEETTRILCCNSFDECTAIRNEIDQKHGFDNGDLAPGLFDALKISPDSDPVIEIGITDRK